MCVRGKEGVRDATLYRDKERVVNKKWKIRKIKNKK